MSPEPSQVWRSRLEAAFGAGGVTVEDESHRHSGHANGPGPSEGGTHAAVRVVSERFKGLGLPARHRLVYAALGFGAEDNALHALTIRALTPSEAAARDAV